MKPYYKLYRNRLPPAYFNNFLPEYTSDYTHNMCNDLICLLIRCEFGAMNAKYAFEVTGQANPSNPPLYPYILISEDTLNRPAHRFGGYI